jgi:hypothetical protein
VEFQNLDGFHLQKRAPNRHIIEFSMTGIGGESINPLLNVLLIPDKVLPESVLARAPGD